MMEKKDIKNNACRQERSFTILPVLLAAGIIIPLALFLWFGSIMLLYVSDREEDELLHIPPMRWLASVLIPAIIASE